MADQPRYRSTEYGTGGPINERVQQARRPAQGPPVQPTEPVGPPVEMPELTPQDDFEAALFGPSKKPGEPISFGAPFGPGPSGTMRLDDRTATEEAVRRMASRPDAPEEVRLLLAKIERGA